MTKPFENYLRRPLTVIAALTALSASAQTPLIEQGRAAIGRGDADAAIAILEKAVAQQPNNADAHFHLFRAYGSKAQQTGMLGAMKIGPKAKAAVERAVALDPRHAEARLGLAELYAIAPSFMGGSYDKAFEQAKELKAIDPVMGHRAAASIYARQKKLDLARKEYLAAISSHPTSAKAHTYYGQHLANVEKNYHAAFDAFDAALKVNGSHMPAVYHLGRSAALGNINVQRGEEALTKYLGYKAKDNEPSHASAYYYLGSIYEKQGKKAQAKRSYQAALKLNPSHKQASEALKRVS